MDWNLTANWDFSLLEQEAFKSVNTGGGSSGGGDFSVDLKLGQVVNGGNEYGGKWSEGGEGKSSKRGKRSSHGNVPAACLVDGCRSDLINCRDYHRRHKVCELHSKTPQVSIGGQNQRFCQQCSRFHCLEEFDEGKRSCRKRLDRHNRRRRKPQHDSVQGAANIFLNYQGTQLLSFSGSHTGSHTNNPSHMGIHPWPEPDDRLDNQQLQLLDKHNRCLGSPSHPEGKILEFRAPPDHLLRSRAISESSKDRTKISNDRFSMAVLESDCALSLLSLPQSQTSQSSVSLSHQQPVEPMEMVLVSGISNGCMICPGGPFNLDPVSLEPPPTLPFHW